jgi:ABC-type transport system involved in cytochrome c biogenesis permease component
MQTRFKEYLQFISPWRSHRYLRSPNDDNTRSRASPALVFTAVVLASLLAILVIDAHRGDLEQLELLAGDFPVEAISLSP